MLGKLWRKWRQRRWWIRWIVYGVTPIVLFYGVEDLRGWWAWKKYRETWEAAGDRFEIDHDLPDPVPDEDNFAATPFIRELYRNDGDFEEPFEFSEHEWRLPSHESAPNRHMTLCREYPFETLYEEGRFDREAAAREILRELAAWDSILEELSAAVERPDCDYPIDLATDGMLSKQHHFGAFIKFARVLKIRSLARLKTGDTAGALADIQLFFDLSRHATVEGTMVSTLLDTALSGIAFEPIWDGLRRRSWDEDQMKQLDRTLEKSDRAKRFGECLLRERGIMIQNLDRLATDVRFRQEMFHEMDTLGYFAEPQFLLPGGTTWADDVDILLSSVFRIIAPRGWYWQNKVNLCRFYESPLRNRPWDPEFRLPASMPPFDPAIVLKQETPYNFAFQSITPSFETVLNLTGRNETRIDLARTAIALERFRQIHGEFPDSIDKLVPEFIEAIPMDRHAKNGEPIRYLRRADGTFAIYSVGLNGIDDGGRPHRSDEKGDLCWHYTLPPGFTLEAFTK